MKETEKKLLTVEDVVLNLWARHGAITASNVEVNLVSKEELRKAITILIEQAISAIEELSGATVYRKGDIKTKVIRQDQVLSILSSLLEEKKELPIE